MEFSGNFNRQFKLNKPVIPVNTEYVTRKKFNEYKKSKDQRLTKIETELKSQVQRIQVVEDKVDRLTEVVIVQGQQIKELQVEQKNQGETLRLILKALEGINRRLDNLESK
ncbi:hypothetical protein Y1241N_2350 [Mycoplasmoides pneumoniae]|nr:hypothetical protein Y1241N_2350 [Mycoplasmoides pneumoniae]GLL60187.1 hypothetical protein OA571N_0690 [Mycoplasmoides pneumoniae]